MKHSSAVQRPIPLSRNVESGEVSVGGLDSTALSAAPILSKPPVENMLEGLEHYSAELPA